MIQITTDSTCDLGYLIKEKNIGIMPLSVILGSDSYFDGIDITPQDIFSYYDRTKELPRTAARSTVEYEEFFQKYVDEGKTVIHYNISSKSSACNGYAEKAAEKFKGKVFVVDSHALSSGQGLLVMRAYDMLESGASAKEVVEATTAIRDKVNTSFIPDRLDYLYKGGRCSRMAMYGANILKIHPLIQMEEGQLVAGKKYRGSMEKCVCNYIEDIALKYPKYDKTRCFITHSSAYNELVEVAKKKVAETFAFDNVIETIAGSVITGHCGKNTLGVLFISE